MSQAQASLYATRVAAKQCKCRAPGIIVTTLSSWRHINIRTLRSTLCTTPVHVDSCFLTLYKADIEDTQCRINGMVDMHIQRNHVEEGAW